MNWAPISIFLASLYFCSTTGASEYRLKLKLNQNQSSQSIRWDTSPETQEPRLQTRSSDSARPIYFVTLHGTPQIQDTSLVYQQSQVPFDSKGNFSIDVEIKSEHETIEVLVVDSFGGIEIEKTELQFSQWSEFLIEQKEPKKQQKKFAFTPGLGFTAISYQQTYQIPLSELTMTVRALAEYWIKGPWSLSASMFFTALPFTSNPSGTQLGFFGGSVSGGYEISHFISDSWRLKILAAYDYTTTFSNTPSLGFVNLQNPHIYPQLTKDFPKGQMGSLYLKYLPVLSGFSLLGTGNFGLAGGGGFSFAPLKNGSTISIVLDVTLIRLNYSSTIVEANSYTLGASYRF